MPPESFELLAASLRADVADLGAFVEALAVKLAAAFPGDTRVERKGFRGNGRVETIEVGLGDERYRLESTGRGITTSRARAVRGIVLKNEELGLDEWIESLARDLADTADRSERGRRALEQLLNE